MSYVCIHEKEILKEEEKHKVHIYDPFNKMHRVIGFCFNYFLIDGLETWFSIQ